MKFHRITVENVNSLYGVQEIDFDDELDGAPLYLIMGPTGSGKTTILDAVCLALFGETPRQPNPQNALDDIGARVNSYGTGTSKAEVEFSIIEEDPQQNGARVRNRYQAGWYFRRAHERPSGNPQTPVRELLKKVDGEWKELASSDTKKDYEGEFDAVLGGMEMQDFLRSVMLAQGEFAALLKADADEKASILERLTDTAVYQELGRRAQDRWRVERDALETLEDEVSAFEDEETSPAEKVEAKRAEREDRRWMLRELDVWRDQAAEYIEWLERRAELKKKRAEQTKALKVAQEDKEEHREAFARIARDREARQLETSPRRVAELESELQEIGEKIDGLKETKKERSEAVDEAQKSLAAKEKALKEAEETYEEAKPKIKKGQTLQTRLQGKREHRADQLSAVQQAADRAREARRELENARTQVQEAEERLADALSVDDGDEDAAVDDWSERLQEKLEGAQKTLRKLLGDASSTKEMRDRLSSWALEASRAESTIDEVEKVQADVEQLDENREELRKKREKLDAERTELKKTGEAAKEKLEELNQKKAQLDLELRAVDLRRELEAGDVCPVCGSDDHPKLAHGAQDEAATIDAEEAELESERDALQKKISAKQDDLKDLRDDHQTKTEKIAEIKGSLDGNKEQRKQESEKLKDLQEAWADQTEGWDTDAEFGDIEAMRRAHEARVEAIQSRRDDLDRAEERVDALRNAEETYQDATRTLEAVQTSYDREVEDCLDAALDLQELEIEVRDIEDDLEALFDDDKDPDERENELESAIKEKREASQEAADAAKDAEQALTETQTELKAAVDQQEKVASEYETKLETLREEVAASETFADLQAVRSALMEADERETLQKRCSAIQERIDDANKELERLNEEVESHDEARPEGLEPESFDLETLKGAKRELDDAVNAANRRIGRLDSEIDSLEQTLNEYRDTKEKLEEQREEFRVWKELKSLIGVGGGEKFKQFAQALNLDRIVERANRRLQGLSERYRLQTKRDESGMPTLDFEILDDYHAGKPRPLSTLSGGETFLVSLALALALADQQQVEMPIETLFLDEGFGTLDRKSLQNAMDILHNLQGQGGEGGRTVGVISHVEALQEQIADQVIVETQQKGRSRIRVSPAGS